ncbi:hypothetical protein [Pseudomonas sp. MYb118]|uniref:hypothetical protein n=1 Tax=Pseudomonas sp. MYb118 TaxID=1848720 RepID=UPI0034CEF190
MQMIGRKIGCKLRLYNLAQGGLCAELCLSGALLQAEIMRRRATFTRRYESAIKKPAISAGFLAPKKNLCTFFGILLFHKICM